MEAKVPRVMIAGTASGSGKTTITCALLRVLVRRGLRVQACKVGPDFIDPLFHERVLETPSRNLDLFLGSEELVCELLADGGDGCDLTVVEGVMGYYDGIAWGSRASSFDVAQTSAPPVVLVVDARGRALSVAAEVAGFCAFRTPSQIRGIILNRVSPASYPQLKEVVERECDVAVLGYLPRREDAALESRHLGLVTPDEVADLRERIDRLADDLARCVDIDALIALAQGAPALPISRPAGRDGAVADAASAVPGQLPDAASEVPGQRPNTASAVPGKHPDAANAVPGQRPDGWGAVPGKRSYAESAVPGQRPDAASEVPGQRADAPCAIPSHHPLIAVARDTAFCFYYRDSLALLERLGARIVYVSPLEDARLPEGTAGLYLGGGYPELHGAQLSANTGFLAAVRQAIEDGMPCIAECGGFEYLHEELEDADGNVWPLVGTIEGRVYPRGSLGRFGYVTLTPRCDGLLTRVGEPLRAHEFHYWESSCPGDALHAQKPQSERSWDCCHVTETLHAGFPHLYLPGCPDAARRFVRACAAYDGARGGGR